jgi:hypothetical protein
VFSGGGGGGGVINLPEEKFWSSFGMCIEYSHSFCRFSMLRPEKRES